MTRLLPSTTALSIGLSLLAGALTVFAFAPFNLWPLQIATSALCFALIFRAGTIRQAALIGAAYGFGWSVCGIHWLFISLHRYGGLPAWMAVLAVAMVALYVGMFYGAIGAASAWLRQRRGVSPLLLATLALPSLWALFEWTRGWLFTGFPWLVSGYAHSVGPLGSYAPIVGVYGIGFIAAWIAASIAVLPSSRRPALLAVVILACGFGLRTIDWTVPHGQPISVRLLQGNVAQEMKFAAEQISDSLVLYRDMIEAAPADLIATPETAIPVLADRLPADYLAGLTDFSRRSRSHLLLGLPASDGPDQYANSVFGFGPSPSVPSPVPTRTSASGSYRYDKQHLVPFGEFIPPGFRWFVDMMHIPLGDFTRGAATQHSFPVKDQQVMPNICYEDLFGNEIARQITAGAASAGMQPTMLLNVSNIAWFGDTIALPQHLQISRMRSLETGLPMLRATNTGATAIVDPKGRVIAQLAPFTRGTLAANVQGMKGLTPYVRLGDAGIVAMSVALLSLVLLLSSRQKPG